MGGVRVYRCSRPVIQSLTSLQISYWLSCYPLGAASPFFATYEQVPNTLLFKDVVKSRIQLRATPPEGTPVQYIARELRAVVAEGGAYVQAR